MIKLIYISIIICSVFFVALGEVPYIVFGSREEKINFSITPPLPPNTAREMSTISSESSSEFLRRQEPPTLPPLIEIPIMVVHGKPIELSFPKNLTIPAIGLQAPVQNVGLNQKGEMDVPDGKTNYVGWYKYGTSPGDKRSAVVDAHVYGAFKKLKHISLGDSIYLQNQEGKKMHFKVTDFKVYPIDEVPLELIFNRSDGKYLNLITCAGEFVPSLGTYNYRLVIFSQLVE